MLHYATVESGPKSSRLQAAAAALVASPWFWTASLTLLLAWPIGRSILASAELPPPPPVFRSVPEFALTDQYNRPFGSHDLRGKVWITQFFRVGASDQGMDLMAELQHRTRGLGPAIHLVSLTVDPEGDSQEIIAAFAKQQRASRRVWSFLTGDPQRVRLLLRDGFAIDPAAASANVLGRFVLVDQKMRIRGFYRADGDGTDTLLRDAGLLINRRP